MGAELSHTKQLFTLDNQADDEDLESFDTTDMPGDDNRVATTPRLFDVPEDDNVAINETSFPTTATTTQDHEDDVPLSNLSASTNSNDEVRGEENQTPGASDSEPEFDDPMGLEAISSGFH